MFPKRQIPVYLFTGFLDAGKTKFINETLMGDKRFTEGKNILLILCEEGEEEYEPTLFAHDNVYCGVIDEQDATAAQLERLGHGAVVGRDAAVDDLVHAVRQTLDRSRSTPGGSPRGCR